MLLGFLDGRGRAYDLNFRTLKRRLADADGTWEMEPGEAFGAEVPLEAAVFLEMPRPHLLMRPTSGTVRASGRRLLFVAEAVERTEEQPTAFNVAIHVPRTAVDFLLRESGGREVLEVRAEEFRGTVDARSELTLKAEGAWVGGAPPASLLLVLRPRKEALAAVAPLGLS
ncbi:MAG TPA: hypothetical protein VGR51_05025 [Thermoplasmata archaeon]|nr:hypothetical protein [Thermoplasmata archaeon]